jgi:DNA polymerase-3 subunit gamma/tau
MVFYRKYRPQKIEDLDNEVVRKSLFSIFSKKSSVHAFLLTGPKGLGKTSSARIIAKVINCEKHKNLKGNLTEKEIEPDNKCSQCISITNGNNLDILEIDGASNRGIDEIRDLKEKINLAPFKAFRKIYIIDEVHMLTTEAFNALLKTLEEPPIHAVFILCTTEPQKVPATILSRCFRINFTRATVEELVRSLQRIVKAEDIKIEKEALLEIAKLSDGSFRDGSKILEEVFVFAGRKTITRDLVNEKYNTLGIGESISEMLEALSNRDLKKGFHLCRELAKQGMDFKFYIETLIERLHFILLAKVGLEKEDKEINLTIAEIKKLYVLLTDAYNETKSAVLPQAPLELAIMEWAEGRVEVLEEPEKLVKEVAKEEPITYPKPSVRSTTNDSFNSLIDEVKNHNNLLAGVLRSCSANEIKDGKLEIIARSKFHKEKLEEEKAIKILEEAAKKVFNRQINVTILQGGENK